MYKLTPILYVSHSTPSYVVFELIQPTLSPHQPVLTVNETVHSQPTTLIELRLVVCGECSVPFMLCLAWNGLDWEPFMKVLIVGLLNRICWCRWRAPYFIVLNHRSLSMMIPQIIMFDDGLYANLCGEQVISTPKVVYWPDSPGGRTSMGNSSATCNWGCWNEQREMI